MYISHFYWHISTIIAGLSNTVYTANKKKRPGQNKHIIQYVQLHFVSKLINCSTHYVFLKKNWKSTNRILSNLQRRTASLLIYQFGHKRCQKKHKDLHYNLLYDIFSKIQYYVGHELWTIKNSFSRRFFDWHCRNKRPNKTTKDHTKT